MKRGPTKATMERLLAEKRAAADLVTDWIPCTTPPVRDGDYDFRLRAGQMLANGEAKRGEFRGGKWFSIDDGDELYAINYKHAHAYEWRGVRRWVLQGPADNLLSLIARQPVTIYLHAARPRSSNFGGLAKARPFKTEAAAQRFADRHQRLKLTAVLP